MSELVRSIKKVFTIVGSSRADYITDGVADDVQIQAAINYVNDNGGGVVYISAGTYVLAANVLLKSGVHLIGSGMGSTIITASVDSFTLIKTTQSGTTKNIYTNVSVSRLTLKSIGQHCMLINNVDGISVTEVEAYFTVITPIRESLWVQHCQNVRMEKNYLHDLTGNGVQVNGCDYFTVIDNRIIGGSDDAIDIDHDFLDTDSVNSRYGVVSNNVIVGVSSGCGIRVENSDYVTVDGNSIANVTVGAGNAAGICVNATTSFSVSRVIVSNNVIDTCTLAGIRVEGDDVTGVIVEGNQVSNSGADGGSDVRGGIILNSEGINCHNNHIDTTAKTGGNGGAIVIYKKDSAIVTDNRILNSVTGIRTWNGDAGQAYTDLVITGNKFESCTNNFAELSATSNCVIFNNHGVNPVRLYAQGNITGATTFTRVNGNTITATATGNVTATITNGVVPGDMLTLIITQDATGGRTITWPSNFKKADGSLVLSTAAGDVDIIKMIWDGTNWRETNRAMNLS